MLRHVKEVSSVTILCYSGRQGGRRTVGNGSRRGRVDDRERARVGAGAVRCWGRARQLHGAGGIAAPRTVLGVPGRDGGGGSSAGGRGCGGRRGGRDGAGGADRLGVRSGRAVRRDVGRLGAGADVAAGGRAPPPGDDEPFAGPSGERVAGVACVGAGHGGAAGGAAACTGELRSGRGDPPGCAGRWRRKLAGADGGSGAGRAGGDTGDDAGGGAAGARIRPRGGADEGDDLAPPRDAGIEHGWDHRVRPSG